MEQVEEFLSYLRSQKERPSDLTLKNYKADIKHFMTWWKDRFGNNFIPQNITKNIIGEYKNYSLKANEHGKLLSASSLERHLSALRKFFHFLYTSKKILANPFEHKNHYAAEKDIWHIRELKNDLILDKLSRLTIKNYIIDIKQFIDWLKKVTEDKYRWELSLETPLSKITQDCLMEYKERLLKERRLSPVSVNRKLASIRRYCKYLTENKLISFAPVFNTHEDYGTRALHLPDNSFKNQEIKSGTLVKESDMEISKKSYSSFPPLRLGQKLLSGTIVLFDLILTIPTVKILDTFSYLLWQIKGKPIFTEASSRKKIQRTNQIPIDIQTIHKDFYAPLAVSTKYFPIHKKLLFHLKHSRPKWYKKYHSYTIAHYFHFSILVIAMSAIGYGWYQSFIKIPQEQNPLFAFSSPASPARVLSFQGRLTDSSDTPITTAVQLKFAIYNDQTTSGSSLLWEETQTITPDSNGVFSTFLGKTSAISQSIFATNSSLWLGVSVGSDPELVPRQQLATVAYASNTETLQGLLPITQSGAGTTNVVLALDSSGNLTIGGSAKPTFQASGGQFKLSGQPLVLATNTGSNGDIQLAPDGSGKIDAQKPLINSGSTNPSGITGAVEVDDLFAIYATSSAQAVLNINQASTGNLISASQNGTARFVIKNKGGAFFEGDVGLNVQSPTARLDVGGDASASGNLTLYAGARSIQTTSNNSLTIGGSSTGNIFILPRNGSGFLGVGTSSPNNTLEVLSTSTPQARFAYDTSNYTTIAVSSAGAVTIDTNGSSAGFTFSDSVTAGNGLTLTTGALSLTATSGSIAITGFGTTSITSTTTTGNITTLADSSFAVAASATGNLVNLTFTNGSTNTSDTSTTTGLNIAITNSSAGTGGTMDTYAIRIQDIAGTSGAGTQNNYGIRIGNQGQSSTETSYGLYIDSQTGSTSSYAAIFAGGNVGIGDTTPTEAQLVLSSDIFVGSFASSGTAALCWDNSGGSLINDCSGNPVADYAEIYPVDSQVEYGEIVAISADDVDSTFVTTDKNGNALPGQTRTISRLSRSSHPYQGNIIGIASENWADFSSTGHGSIKQEDNPMPVALNGRVLVKVSGENGPIKQGDYLTSSSIPGLAMKATRPGPVIGKALEDFVSQGETLQGKIMVFVTISWHDPTVFITDTGDINIVKSNIDQTVTKNINSQYSLDTKTANIAQEIGVFSKTVTAMLQTGFIKAEEIATQTITSTTANLGNLVAQSIAVTTDNITIAGEKLDSYIVKKIEETLEKKQNQENIVSPVAQSEIIETSFISPLAQEPSVNIKLEKDKISIVNTKKSTSSALFSIDASGSATFSGQLSANRLQTNTIESGQLTVDGQASISGTLRAGKIIANSIEGLEANIVTLAAKYISSSSPTQSASPSSNLLPTMNNELITNNYSNIASFSAQLARINELNSIFGRFDQGLIVLGPASFSDTSIAGQLSIGARFIFAQDSINVLGSDLELQPLRQGGLSIMAGLVHIDQQGNIKVSGDAEFANNLQVKGKIYANLISPLSNNNLSLRLGDDPRATAASSLVVQDSSGSAILNLDQKGNLTASGSARFSDVLASVFNVVRGAQADTSFTTTIASSSAGTATIIEGETQRTVLSPYINENSLIYLSPASDTESLIPYLARQTPTTFTIAIPQRATKDILVNWWIIN